MTKKSLMILLFLPLFGGCIIIVKPPKFNIVGKRTIIERQMIGAYRDIKNDKMLKSSYKK
jgi:hypothetical protein